MQLSSDAIVIGSLPSLVYKGFERQDYAEDFVTNGRMRLGSIESYRTAESDTRRDRTEGEAYVITEEPVTSIHINPKTGAHLGTTVAMGQMHNKSSCPGHAYVFCLSDISAGIEYVQKTFGSFVVEIFDTRRFVQAIQRAASRPLLPNQKLSAIHVLRVNYNKGMIGTAFNPHDPQFAYAQKPQNFRDDHEWRIVLVFFNDLGEVPNELFIEFPESQAFARHSFQVSSS